LIDIHCHILPGVDDGAKDMEMALTMAKMASDDGIETIIATPHFNNIWRIERETVVRKAAELQAEIDRLGLPLTIRHGNEVRMESAAFIKQAIAGERFCYLADNRKFVLMEQPWEGFCTTTWELVETLRDQGTTIILAHPERHIFFRAEPTLLDRMIDMGVWTQVSVGSLIGENGPDAQAFAERLADRGLAHTLATDAHNMTRKPLMALGFRAVAERKGEAAADAIRDRMRSILAE
jgi:protein-tyrosine phosphatase